MHFLKNNIFQLIVLTGIIGLGFFFLHLLYPGQWFHSRFYQILMFFFILTMITSLVAEKLMGNNELNSVPVILGIAVLRLLASIVFVFIILWQEDENLLWFVVDFFIIYLLYLLFDLYGLITNLRLHSK